jgi:hypothetical protein
MYDANNKNNNLKLGGSRNGSRNGSTNNSNSKSGNSKKGKDTSCGNECPTACFANAIQAAQYNQQNNPYYTGPKPETLGSQRSRDTTYANFAKLAFGKNECSNQYTSLYGKDDGTKTIEGYTITNEPQTSTETTLNDNINKLIDKLFQDDGPNKPTNYLINLFNSYVKGNPTIDTFHKNKLRDVVYYLMENIIPGLPTDNEPVSYVEWRPIRWLSHSSL